MDPAARVTDTIAAIATAIGPAGVGIVRISGPAAFALSDRLTPGTRLSTAHQNGHTLRRAVVCDPDSRAEIDDVLRAVFHAPASFTGEDVVEMQGHGGAVTLARVLDAALRAGARVARPGEFTERAFVNGKIDLSRAEAVADLINARTVVAQRAAQRQAAGALSANVREIAAILQGALAAIEASIDFPEEVGDADPDALDAALTDAASRVQLLLGTAGYGRRLMDGIVVVLAGRPNVGKSSLLNALSGAERAIVTPHPGTTRDIVEEALNLAGLPVRALDTAGVRESDDPVERIGIERARRAMTEADAVVVVLDAVSGWTSADAALVANLSGRPIVFAVNKADAAPADPVSSACRTAVSDAPVVATSATTGLGLGELASAIAAIATGESGEVPDDAVLVTSARHETALRCASSSIAAARRSIADAVPIEMIAVDLHGALQSLGEITGESTREDVIAAIFARFCIGK